MRKISGLQIFLIFAVFIVILYFVIIPYYNQYLESERCRREICSFELDPAWKESGCLDTVNDSLAYKAHIVTSNISGSVADFDCQLGPSYHRLNPQRLAVLNCSIETVTAIDSVVKGKNTTPVSYMIMEYVYPANFTDYTAEILYCRKTNTYSIYFFIERSGVFYE